MGALYRWAVWSRENASRPPLPADGRLFSAYLLTLVHSPSSAQQCAAAVAWASKFLHLSDPTQQVEVSRTLTWLKKQAVGGQKRAQKLAVTPEMIGDIVAKYAHAEASLCDLRAAVICVVSYVAFFRISELLSLRMSDVRFTGDESVTFHIRRTKNDQFGKGSDRIVATGYCACELPYSFVAPLFSCSWWRFS